MHPCPFMAGMHGLTLTPSFMWEISVRRLRRLEEYSITRYRGHQTMNCAVSLNAWWSLFNTCAYLRERIASPTGFHPPGCASFSEGTNERGCLIWLISRSFTFHNDIERSRQGAMLINVGFHSADI